MNQEAPIEEVLEALLRYLEKFDPGSLCEVFLLDETGQKFFHGAGASIPENYRPVLERMGTCQIEATSAPLRAWAEGEGANATLLNREGENSGHAAIASFDLKRRMVVDDISEHPLWNRFHEDTPLGGRRSFWAEPILGAGGDVLGSFAIYHSRPSVGASADFEKLAFGAQVARLAIEQHRSSVKLRESDMRFRAIFEGAAEGIVVADPDNYTIRFANPASCQIFGYSKNEIVGLSIKALCPSFLLADRKGGFYNPINGPETNASAVTCVRKDQTAFSCNISYCLSELEGKSAIIGFFSGITETQKIVDIRKQSEEILNEAQKLAKIGSFEWKLQGRKTTWSSQLYDILGLSTSVSPSIEAFERLIAPHERSLVRDWVKQVSERGGQGEPIEFRIRRGTGEIGHVKVHAKIEADGKGQIQRFFGTIQDITEQVQLAEAVRKNEEFFQSVFQSSVAGVFVAEQKTGEIVRANQTFLKMVGYSQTDLPLRWDHLTPPDWAKKDEFAREQLDLGRFVPPYEAEYLTKDGVRIPILAGIGPIKGQVGFLICFVLDITERKKTDREIEKRSWMLVERVKEMRAIHAVSQRFEDPESPLAELLQFAAETVGQGFQYPQIVCVRIEFRNACYSSRHAGDLLFEISCPIEVAGRREGSITVGYTEALPENPWCDDAFIMEEMELAETIAIMIGSRITSFEVKAELERSKKSLLKAQSIAQMCSWAFDTRTQTDQGSEEYLRMINWPGSELALKDQKKMVHPEDLTIVLEAWSKGLSGMPCDIEFRVQIEGKTRWFHSVVEPQLDSAGQVRELLGVTQDVTDRKKAEKRLRFQNDILKGTGRIAKVGGWSLEVASGEVFWTDEIARIHDLDESYRPNLESSFDFYPRRSKEVLERATQEAINRNKPYDLELELLTAKGVRKWVRTICDPVMENGKVVRLHGSYQDITERITANQALDRERNLLRVILGVLPDLIWLKDGDGLYRFCNGRYEKLLGKKEPQIVGRTDFDLSPRKNAERARALDLQTLDSRTRFVTEEWREFADGHRELQEILRVPIHDPAGELIGILGIGRDITLQRQAEETLRRFNTDLESRVTARTTELAARTREFELLVQSIPDAVVRIDESGTILFSKKSTEDGFDWFDSCGRCARSECAACTSIDLAIEVGKKVRTSAKGKTVLMGGSAVAEKELPGGSVLELRVAPLADRDYLILARDISARRKLEEETKAALKSEKELSMLKARFFSVASHEFRTPMAAIAGSIDLLQNFSSKITEVKRGELFNRVVAGIDRLRSIIDDVLALSRVDGGKLEVARSATDLVLLFKDVISEAEVGDKGGHRFEFASSGDTGQIPTDPKLLHHVLSNLLSNATRYSPPGTSIRVELGREGDRCWFAVQDEGIGIPEGDRAHLFEPFYRASNVGQIRGTGLGLNIVKRYIDLLEGEIELANSAKGARFLASIPALPKPPQ